MKEQVQPKQQNMVIRPPNFPVAHFRIRGNAELVQNRWTKKALQQMASTQESGEKQAKGRKRAPRDFEADFQERSYRFKNGDYGFPAKAIRDAMIETCRVLGFKMTHAKMCIFCEPDGNDATDGMPLVKLYGSPPVKRIMAVRNATGVADLRSRPHFGDWWADLRIKFDGDIFGVEDIANLLMRAGIQCGIMEGRPFSRDSSGMGWGTWEVIPQEQAAPKEKANGRRKRAA